MDWTVIRTISGKTFPVDEFDWKLWHPDVPRMLRRLHAEGVRLAIISNQMKISRSSETSTEAERRAEVMRKVDAIIGRLAAPEAPGGPAVPVPVDYICATTDDIFRKPMTGE